MLALCKVSFSQRAECQTSQNGLLPGEQRNGRGSKTDRWQFEGGEISTLLPSHPRTPRVFLPDQKLNALSRVENCDKSCFLHLLLNAVIISRFLHPTRANSTTRSTSCPSKSTVPLSIVDPGYLRSIPTSPPLSKATDLILLCALLWLWWRLPPSSSGPWA